MARSPLPLLIRQAEATVDERRAELAAVAAQEDRAVAAVAAHDARQAAEEAGLTDILPVAMANYAAWLRNHGRERARLADRAAKLARSREAAEDALREACAALKGFELANEARLKAERRAAAKRAEAKAEEMETIRRGAGPGVGFDPG